MRAATLPALLAALAWAALSAQQSPAVPATGTGVIAGRVVDAGTGQGVEGARVSILRQPYITDLPSAQTGPDGVFTLTELPPGEYTVWASKAGYLEGAHGRRRPGGPSVAVPLGGGERTSSVRIPLWPSAALVGHVFDERGAAVPGVTVHALRRSGSADLPEYRSNATATTDDRGEYRITRLTAGDYVVVVPCTAESRVLAGVPPASGPSAGRGGGWIEEVASGTLQHLVDPAGRTVLLPRGPLPPGPGANGRPRAYVTSAAGGERLRNAHLVHLGEGESREGIDVHLELRQAARISGTVTSASGPVVGTIIRLMPEGWDGPEYLAQYSANVAPDGSFTLMMVPEGRYSLVAWRRVPPLSEVTIGASGSAGIPMDDVIGSDQNNPWARMSLAVGDTDIAGLAIVLREAARVSGTIVYEDAPQEFRAPRFSLYFASPGNSTGGNRPSVGPDGAFTARLSPGRYIVEAQGSGLQGWTLKSMTVRGRDIGNGPLEVGNDDLDGVAVTFTSRTGSLAGIAGTEGQPDDASVIVFSTDRNAWPYLGEISFGPRWRAHMVRAKGRRYAIDRILPGEYFVAAVPEEMMSDWPSHAFLERLAKEAARVQINEWERRSLDLPVIKR